jgi:hypothetical protein
VDVSINLFFSFFLYSSMFFFFCLGNKIYCRIEATRLYNSLPNAKWSYCAYLEKYILCRVQLIRVNRLIESFSDSDFFGSGLPEGWHHKKILRNIHYFRLIRIVTRPTASRLGSTHTGRKVTRYLQKKKRNLNDWIFS